MNCYVYCEFDSKEVGDCCQLLGEFATLQQAQKFYKSIKRVDDMMMPTRSEEERQYIIGKSLFSEDEQIECKEVK